MEKEPEELRIYKKQALRICSEIYGYNTKNYKLMEEKIKNCENDIQVSNTMAWGRHNLMR